MTSTKILKNAVLTKTKMLGEVPVVEDGLDVPESDLRLHLKVLKGEAKAPSRWGPQGKPFWASEAPDAVLKKFNELGDADQAVTAYRNMLKGTGMNVVDKKPVDKAPVQRFGSARDGGTSDPEALSQETAAELDKSRAGKQVASTEPPKDPAAGLPAPLQALDKVGRAVFDVAGKPVEALMNEAEAQAGPKYGTEESRKLMTYGPVTDADPLDAPKGVPGPMPIEAGAQSRAPQAGVGSFGGSFRVQDVDPAAVKASADATAQAALSAKDAARVARESSDALSESSKATRTAMLEDSAAAEKFGALAAEARRTHAQAAERMNARMQGTLARARELATAGVDPGRFWNSRGDGQKALAVISAALWGLAGKGQEALARLDALVSEDNALQAADAERGLKGLEAEAAGFGAQRDFLMQKGASEAEVALHQQAAKYQSIKSRVEAQAMASKDADTQMRAAELSAGLDQRIASLTLQGREIAGQEAAAKNQARFNNAKLELDRQQNDILAAKAAAASKSKDVPEATQHRISSAAAEVQNLVEMGNLMTNTGVVDRMGRRVKAALGSTEEVAKDKAYEQFRVKWAKAVLGEALSKEERAMIDEVLASGTRSDLIDKWPTVMRLLGTAQTRLGRELNIAEAGQHGDIGALRASVQPPQTTGPKTPGIVRE